MGSIQIFPRTETFNRAAIMRRAWQLFSTTYNFPRTSFNMIGRHCFASCLRMAWEEAKAPVPVKRTHEQIRADIFNLEMTTTLGVSGLNKLHALNHELAHA